VTQTTLLTYALVVNPVSGIASIQKTDREGQEGARRAQLCERG